ncbi:MAG: hypothetical protein ABL958_16025 [Bdellovibrionia bacterium]
MSFSFRILNVCVIAAMAAIGLRPSMLEAQSTERLSEVALFNRCFTHITQLRLPRSNPLWAAVRDGTLTAANACMLILDSAVLQSSGPSTGLLQTDNDLSRLILKTFNDFHRGWFPNDNVVSSFSEGGENYQRTPELTDESEPALHLTRVLFTEGARYSEIVTSNSAMEALRTSGALRDDNLPDANRLKSRSLPGGATTVTLNALHVQRGALLGIRPMTSNPQKLVQTVNSGQGTSNGIRNLIPDRPIEFNQSLGGGILGTKSYLALNLGLGEFFPANGGIRVPRRWSKALLKDLVCRDLPALRLTDAVPHVQSSIVAETPPFRGNASCMACHATMDPLAGVVRNISYLPVPNRVQNATATGHVYKWATDLPAETGPVDLDPEFFRRPTSGRILFRGYAGALVSRAVQSPGEVGQLLSETDDLYVCAAARYIDFFTGVMPNLQDEGDPARGAVPAKSKPYRELAIKLGLELKQHQNLRTIIRAILESDLYRRSNLRDSIEEGG